MFFSNNIAGHIKEQLITELEIIQSIPKIPLLFSVDEEDGTVCRVSLYFRKERLPSPRYSYLKGGFDEILPIEKGKKRFIEKIKIQFEFSPVS